MMTRSDAALLTRPPAFEPRAKELTLVDALLVPLRGTGRGWMFGPAGASFALSIFSLFAGYAPMFLGVIILFVFTAIWLHALLRFSSSCLSGAANGEVEPDFGVDFSEVGMDWAVSGFGLALYGAFTIAALTSWQLNGTYGLGLALLVLWWPFGFAVAATKGTGWAVFDVQSAFRLLTGSPVEVLVAGFIGGCATVVGSYVHSWASGLLTTGDALTGGGGGSALATALGMLFGAIPLIYGMAATGALMGRVIHRNPETAEGL